jgi:endonuclease G, mitochondrial
MRKSSYLLIITLLGFSVGAMAQPACDSAIRSLTDEKGYQGCVPKCKTNLQVVGHDAYTLGYSEKHEQAAWVCYVLSKSECTGDEERSGSFFEDKSVKTGSACNADYAGSGYDRGHLAPAGDMSFSATAMKESFFYSNMSPQVPQFNRGVWKKLETQVREWGTLYGNCLVITGPVLKDSLKTIGTNGVAIPEMYYKIVVNANASPPQAIGFLLRNEGSTQPLTNFVVTIDSIETVTGIDFFSTIAAPCQQKLESRVSGSHWKGFELVTIAPAAAPATSSAKKKQQPKN